MGDEAQTPGKESAVAGFLGIVRPRAGRVARACLLAPLAGAAALGAGCRSELNTFMDPSVVGRWEYTPTTVPILERLDIIEEDEGDFVETSEVLPEDLIPEAAAYELAPGDQVRVEIFDFLTAGALSTFERVIDARGFLSLPQLGVVQVAGQSAAQTEDTIARLLKEKGIIVQDPLVTVVPLSQRDATFTVFGAVGQVGRYVIPKPDYRLLDALTEAGGVSPSADYVYVIRQAALTDAAQSGLGAPAQPRDAEQPPADDGETLENLIDELTEPGDQSPSPAAFAATQPAGTEPAQPAQPERPVIDLPPDEPTSRPAQDEPEAGQWVFLDGRWVRVRGKGQVADGGLAEGAEPLVDAGPKAEDIVTQRVIKAPLAPLLQGNAAYNIVVRPGDAIRVPPPEAGLVYVTGPGAARPGVYNLPTNGRLTLTKVIAAAGGLSAIGVPNRTDLTRMVGEDRQATIRLNLRAIFEGAEPDVFLKPDDVVNIGTAWWAQPLAVIRNGFRTSYGFGFLLDRNFGNDVFGAPPTNFNR